jgi:hypothetical protein
MTKHDVLVVRLEMVEATERNNDALDDVLTNPILRCECDPSTCNGCIDCTCFN